jgi:hypothetical protein
VSARRRITHLAIAAACSCLAACAGQVTPALSAPPARREALLVLPGFGYSRDGEHALRAATAAAERDGIDLYVPVYMSRHGLAKSRSRLRAFIRDQRLDQYERVHVFAFIAGAWTLNPLVDTQELPNLGTIVYDRSPLQERAARLATDHLHFLTWVRYGSPVFDFANTPYPAVTTPGVRVGLVVETQPTTFVRRHEIAVRSYGPVQINCDVLTQRYDDCVYVAMNHSDVYKRFAEVWPDVLAFIRTGSFTATAERTPPTVDPFVRAARP